MKKKNIIEKSIEKLTSISEESGNIFYFDELPEHFAALTPEATSLSHVAGGTLQQKAQSPAQISNNAPPPSGNPQQREQLTHQKSGTAYSIPQKDFANAEPLPQKNISAGVNVLSIDPKWINSGTLEEMESKINKCMKCDLGVTRDKFVFGKGSSTADIMIIGEAPGNEEDKLGEPFVGRAGQLLTKILEAIGLSRDEVFIGNIIKCRPPANRRPTSVEVTECEPYLLKQIELIQPKFILALGLTAADTLLKKTHKMADARGKLFDYNGIPTMVTYHPAALLRNPAWKKFVWEDVQLLRKLYDEKLSTNK